jgi:hypothetical protein
MSQLWWMRGPLRDKAGEGTDGGGGVGDAPPPFDPAAFQKSLMDAVNKTINGAIKNLKTELGKKPDPEPNPDPDPEPEPKGGDKTDPKVRALEKQISSLTAKYEAAEKARQESERKAEEKERHAAIRSELSKFNFASDGAREAAFKIFRDDIRRGDDGSLIGGSEDAPLAQFIEDAMKQHEYLLAPKPAGGAGASSGNRKGTATVSLDDIKPGMTKEQEAAALAAIRQHFPGVK